MTLCFVRRQQLGPYSPELTPIEIERVWKLIQRRCLRNRYLGQLDEVIESVENELAGCSGETTYFAGYANLLKTLCLDPA